MLCSLAAAFECGVGSRVAVGLSVRFSAMDRLCHVASVSGELDR